MLQQHGSPSVFGATKKQNPSEPLPGLYESYFGKVTEFTNFMIQVNNSQLNKTHR